jgi:hypothetical protein
LETAGRTVTDADIVNFSNVSWDHFYAHTDATSLTGTILIKQLLTDISSFQQQQDYLFPVKKDLLSQITD